MAKILTICPYPLIPLRGGGALRCFHLLRQLARCHEVHAIIFQKESELRQEREGYSVPENVRVYSPIDTPPPFSLFDLLPRKIAIAFHYRWLRRDWSGPAGAELLGSYHLIRKVLAEQQIDLVLFEHLNTMSASPFVRRFQSEIPFILDAHNVDFKLIEQEFKRSPEAKKPVLQLKLDRTRDTERNLDRHVNAVWACSEDDRAEFEAHNTIPVFTIPNGVDTGFKSLNTVPTRGKDFELLFCGSFDYLPNVHGLQWFLGNVWPSVLKIDPRIRLLIVGRGGKRADFSAFLNDQRIEFVGEVPDVAPYYRRASVSICPLLMGSGTRLKILEAMSLGVPVVSTAIGAQGIHAEHEKHILLADDAQAFANAIGHLFSDRNYCEELKTAARHLMEERYDWDVIGNSANRSIAQLLQER